MKGCKTKVPENNAQKVEYIKSKTKAQDYRIRGPSQKCKSKLQDNHSKHCICIKQRCKTKSALHMRQSRQRKLNRRARLIGQHEGRMRKLKMQKSLCLQRQKTTSAMKVQDRLHDYKYAKA